MFVISFSVSVHQVSTARRRRVGYECKSASVCGCVFVNMCVLSCQSRYEVVNVYVCSCPGVCVYETLQTLWRAECFLTPVGLGLSQWNRKVSSAQASEPSPSASWTWTPWWADSRHSTGLSQASQRKKAPATSHLPVCLTDYEIHLIQCTSTTNCGLLWVFRVSVSVYVSASTSS